MEFTWKLNTLYADICIKYYDGITICLRLRFGFQVSIVCAICFSFCASNRSIIAQTLIVSQDNMVDTF